ncbi:MAG: hypothetical protein ACFCUI_07365 [Bernardetiaceae bacterium]
MNKNEPEEKPPFFAQWRSLYLLVLGELILLIALFYGFTSYYG